MMENRKTLEEIRKIFEGDRFATENGAVIEEIGRQRLQRQDIMLENEFPARQLKTMGRFEAKEALPSHLFFNASSP